MPKRPSGHANAKVSTVNLKQLQPSCSGHPYTELEYLASDPLNGGKASVTMWVGPNCDDCESKYEICFTQARQKRFEIPGIPFKFVLVNGTIYYRRNVE